ncbi:hypothetical protein [Myxosarcina sp. GI1(2024)]
MNFSSTINQRFQAIAFLENVFLEKKANSIECKVLRHLCQAARSKSVCPIYSLEELFSCVILTVTKSDRMKKKEDT